MKSVNHHSKLSRTLLSSLTFLFVFLVSFSVNAQDVDAERQKAGRKLFNANCASCHKLDKKSTGPALGGVEQRRENEWLKKWIRNNAELRASGDADAIAIYEEYNQSNMTAFPQLTDQNIDDILYYTTVGNIGGGPKGPEGTTTTQPINQAPKWLIWILAAAIIVAFLIIGNLLKTVSELKGAPKTPGLLGQAAELWEGIKKNTFLHVLFVIFGALITAYVLFGTLFKVGVDQGYQPVQPILFSHKIHAGDNKIECQYCHSAAKHSKHSGIPSLNVCMNCHKNISEVAEGTQVVLEEGGRVVGKTELDKEIAKIYEHVGWDKDKLEYTGNTKPIEWVRIHNLPDFAYFNHSQHVTVAGVKCQKCHGPVEEMEELYQYSPLTMGWCIDCHKETNVDLKGNEYYAKIHADLAKKYGVEQVTIAQLGGKECGKCHY
ncbi:quinol:cytochrome c oxidoreductase pentaheme cytochrome subunit [Tenacibaculum skagerrakense]|uniref:Quinol:cytochrome c oxidoreductase pentaheme cytochrome subunit n=1 Tax=Tenacibaculum skagerrakense TaxID=186571 RepID=A0A4R2NP74_9FLAO|nr:c-type cytochrome [Tenacibaculum skagerrakense]TCP23537.1 quinol:cytochrome c oxidoreductase pentaheme cytochrome subunit [Tenacibaculum skagerrakense]